jgi:hypothetical protein
MAGPKVTVRSSVRSPSEEVVAAAKTTATITDPRGRKITIKRIGPVDRMRLAGILGSDNAKNEVIMGYAVLAFSVMAIDGEPEPPCQSMRAIEHLVSKLDDDGLMAVGLAHESEFGIGQDVRERADDIKN